MNNTTNLHRQTESTFSWLPRNVTAATESTTFAGSEVTDHHNVPNEITQEDSSIYNSTDSTTHWLQRTEEEEGVMNNTTKHWLQRTEEEGRVMNDTTTELLYLNREDTQVEMILNMVFTAFFFVTILTANILLLVVMWRFKRLQPCNRLVRTVTAICDIIMGITGANLITSITAFKYVSPDWFCLINSKVLSVCLSVLINANGLLAVERYIYIVHPMKYQVWVNKSRIILSLLGTMFPSIICLSINTFLSSTELRRASFICVNQSSPVLFFLVIPGIVITSMGIINLYRFLRKAAANSSEAIDAKKAIKLTLLLSGAIFTTYLPAFIIRMAVVQVWSLEEIDAGVNITGFIAVRCASFIISLGSSACNPVIQFYVEKDLWVGLRKIMGQKAYFSEQLDALEAVNSRD